MTILRCPWLRCDFTVDPNQQDASISLGQHLLDHPSNDKHRNLATDEPAPSKETEPRPVVIGPEVMPTPGDLHIGVVVIRYTEPLKGDWVITEMPCCPRDRFDERLGRALRLPTANDEEGVVAICPPCRWRWNVSLDDKGGKDYTAVFRLVDMVAVADTRRNYKSL